METETEVKPLTAEDVVRIVEETLDKREGKARSKPARSEPETPAIDVDALAKKVGESVAEALDRHAAKQAEAEKSAVEKGKGSPYDF